MENCTIDLGLVHSYLEAIANYAGSIAFGVGFLCGIAVVVCLVDLVGD